MKKLIAIILVLASVAAMGQDLKFELKGAIGLTFGMSKDDVSNVFKQKGGVLDVKHSKPDRKIYDNILVGTRKSDFVLVKFVKNKLFEINIFFSPSLSPLYQDLFDNLKEDLSSKYGDGKCYRNFSGVFKDGDGYEETAIKSGYADIVCYWSEFIDKNVVSLKVTPELLVHLQYQDTKLVDEKILEENQKNVNDL